MTISKHGKTIATLEDWQTHAGPKLAIHWKDGRSAKESAKAWLAIKCPALPLEIASLLKTNKAFGTVSIWDAEPEARLRFDDFTGEPRNADLVVHAQDEYGKIVLAVEAKADETFGETVADALAAAVERMINNPRSKGIQRVEQLAASILGPRSKGDPQIGKLRYQLLTAVAGALRGGEIRSAPRVVLLIHEFKTDVTTDRKLEANAADLTLFVKRLSHGAVQYVHPGTLYGPFPVPGVPLFTDPPQLFIGKACVNLRHTGP